MNYKSNTRAALMAIAAGSFLTPTLFAQLGGGGSGAGTGGTPSETITLVGVVRDFKGRNNTGGHPDFELNPTRGFNQYMGEVKDSLDAYGKPQYNSKGFKLTKDWKDSAGRNRINNKSYIAAKAGDVAGTVETVDGGALTSAERFAEWFRDVPGVNVSKTLPITLKKNAATGVYTFDDKMDQTYVARGGFFPIDEEMYGNYPGYGKNFHFTFELDTEFVCEKGKGQVFSFTGDDDVWVFVDGKLVIDIGGIHSARNQSIEIDRLTWLEDGKTYNLKFFFAERHTTQSNFRIDTNLKLKNLDVPQVSALYD